MAEDREILKEIWEGKLPVCFNLSMDELYTMDQPEPYYILAPRQTYFPLITDKVQRHFIKHIEPGIQEQSTEIWLEYEGKPLKWHYPIGVLFDMFNTDTLLPWNITVHFQNFPEEEILHCPSKSAVESHFMSTVKEADALKHKSQVINNLQKKDHRQLWTGLQNDRFDLFWGINKKLMEGSNDDTFKYVPYRIHRQDKVYLQKLVKPMKDTGQHMTLHDLLIQLDIASHDEEAKQRVLVQGITPPMETTLLWLSEHFSYPDNFLHICLVDK
ncbi:unnamed protein product [Owenia fusiformis]|uniref:Autophagy protein 5 n=1 Tax=Owenia fusiformis TaxID=6347 RepID=A0A8J1XIQ3_OWEFU|nr:unnamed protein product [Owenia fusiformis]